MDFGLKQHSQAFIIPWTGTALFRAISPHQPPQLTHIYLPNRLIMPRSLILSDKYILKNLTFVVRTQGKTFVARKDIAFLVINLHYGRGIAPKRVTSGAHLRRIAPGLHSSEETSKRGRTVGDTALHLTGMGIKLTTFSTNNDVLYHQANCL